MLTLLYPILPLDSVKNRQEGILLFSHGEPI